MKAVKSIFDKSYIVEAQAIKAGEKEWPQGTPLEFVLSFDEATRKWRWIRSVCVHPELAAAELEMPDDVVAERVPGFSHCPACEVDLSNGVLTDGDEDGNGKAIKMEAFMYECMGCGHEFGPDIKARKAAERQANASMGVAGAVPRLSTAIRPTKLVWEIADQMPKASRKEVMAACVEAGVAYGTARTQYQAWFKASQDSKREDIRQPYQKGE